MILEGKYINNIIITLRNFSLGPDQGLLYHKTRKPDFLCRWPSLNSYLESREIFEGVLYL